LKLPWAMGQIGELLVRLFAHWQLDRHTYPRLHNVTLNTPDGTTQIDHLFLSPSGFFVLESAVFQLLPIGLYLCIGDPCCR
ncbi:nuclease-related domain-containing protein, partial [Pseudomonas aeruginosa]